MKSFVAFPADAEPPTVNSIDDAEFWLQVMYRQESRSAARIFALEEAVRRLQRPWWRRWLRRG